MYRYIHGLSSNLLLCGYSNYQLLTAQTREAKYGQCIITMSLFYILENILGKLHISVKSILKYNILGPHSTLQ
jgi:hypothetical protein